MPTLVLFDFGYSSFSTLLSTSGPLSTIVDSSIFLFVLWCLALGCCWIIGPFPQSVGELKRNLWHDNNSYDILALFWWCGNWVSSIASLTAISCSYSAMASAVLSYLILCCSFLARLAAFSAFSARIIDSGHLIEHSVLTTFPGWVPAFWDEWRCGLDQVHWETLHCI